MDGASATIAVAPHMLVPTAINKDKLSETLNLSFKKETIIIDDNMHGIITIKLFDPYCMKSNKLNLIPRNIIPSLSKYFIQNLNPETNLMWNDTKLFNNNPITIAKIIGDKGLFLNPRKLIPTKSDKVIANEAVIIHRKIPR